MYADNIKEAFARADRELLMAELRMQHSTAIWRAALVGLTLDLHKSDSAKFQSLFVEFGHKIRASISDDSLLISTLFLMLPSYEGPGMTIFRGENLNRYLAGRLGPSWTTRRSVAEMFGQGLNAVESGGVLLTAWAPPQVVIAPPNAHSQWLGEEEYLVDPAGLQDITILDRYPKSPLI